MSDTTNALNVIGRPYNSDAVMIGRAYDFQDTIMRADRDTREEYRARGAFNTIDGIAREYVQNNQSDRRYRLHVLASTGASALVRYRGKRYYVEGIYSAESKSRTFFVYSA